jgi:hypothetical protein
MSQGDKKLEAGGWWEQSRWLSSLGGLKAFVCDSYAAAVQLLLCLSSISEIK